jgi:hypothetical protein
MGRKVAATGCAAAKGQLIVKPCLSRRLLFSIGLFTLGFTRAAHAQGASAPAINEADRISLRGNVHPRATRENDIGRVSPDLPMQSTVLLLKLRPGAQQELDALTAAQQNPASPLYHKWLTPEEFGKRFGISDQDLNAVTGWLKSHGFTIDEVAKGRNWLNFSGNVASIENAFQTQIHKFSVDGEVHQANISEPTIPRALSPLVRGIVSLHDFHSRSMHTQRTEMIQPDLNLANGEHALAPADFAVIYNLTGLYFFFNGTGQSIAIVGRSNINLSDIRAFRSFFSLQPNDPVITIVNTDPGMSNTRDEGEADLDVEWAGAVAPSATIQFVTAKSTSTDGVVLAAQYIVNNNLAPVMSTSFGLCEASLVAGGNDFWNSLWQQAASQGITAFVASGDSGAAGCDNKNATTAVGGQAVSGISSTPFNVAVGGTEFNEGSGTYWSSINAGGTHFSALSYIPEVAWNESGSNGGTGLHSSGGGASSIYPKPSWQTAPGVPADGARDVPDVSLTAAAHDGYVVCQADVGATCVQGSNGTPLGIASGTSASSPSFAGIMALVVQHAGSQRQGNANPALYSLGDDLCPSGGVHVFHDITAGNNSVPGVDGFSAAAGYDPVTGLGSVDANFLVGYWGSGLTTAQLPLTGPASASAGVAFNITVSAQNINCNTNPAYAGTVHFTTSDGQAILPADYTFVPADNGVHTFIITLRAAGRQVVAVTDIANNSLGGSAQINVNPGPASHFLFGSEPVTTTAGTAFTAFVAALDAFNNTAKGYQGTVHFTSTDGQATLPSDYNFAGQNGLHYFFNSFVLGTGGTQTISATDTADKTITGTTNGITVTPGSVDHCMVVLSPSSVIASTAANVNMTVSAKDAYNNTTPTYSGTVHFTSGDSQATLPADYSFQSADNGVHNFSAALRTAGFRTVATTDTVTSSIAGVSNLVTVTNAAASKYSLTLPPTATQNVPFPVRLVAQDQFSNMAKNYAGTAQFSTSDAGGGVVLPPNYTFLPGDSGQHMFSAGFTLQTPGAQSITATDVGNGAITATNPVTVVSDAFITPAGRDIRIFRANIPVIVATFTDADPGEDGSNYTATIDWGDGTSDTNCTLGSSDCQIIRINTGNIFNVIGKHTYNKKGFYTVKVSLTDNGGGSQAVAFSTARFFPINASF